MEAIDTVMIKTEAKKIILAKHCSPETTEGDIVITDIEQDLIEAQAEISFKAGRESEVEDSARRCAAYLESARQEGRKEVVEWIDGNGIWAQVPFKVKESEETMWCLFPNEWQSFKKKLGL